MNDELTSGAPSPQAEGPATQPAELPAPEEPAPASTFGPPSAGGMIRAARQAQGIDLASLAAMLKIPLRRLEALEQGRHDELQGPTFERALAQAACRALKIDPKPVLALLPQHERNALEGVSDGLNTPFRERQGGGGLDLSTLARPVVLAPVLLLLAAAALLFAPAGLLSRWVHPVVASLSTDAPSDAASAPAAAAVPVAASPAASEPAAVADAAARAPVADVGASAEVASTTPPVAPSGSAATASPPTSDDDALTHPSAAAGIPVQVTATADSWVEVVDAQGHTLLSRTVVSGESVGLDGALPMRVKVGNARGTRLTLRGDNVDLAPWTRDNVARLELK